MAYFITDQDYTKGREPNIDIIIHNIKDKTSVNILASNYTNKDLEPTLEDVEGNNIPFHDPTDTHSTNSITTQEMMAEQVKPNSFDPPHHTLE